MEQFFQGNPVFALACQNCRECHLNRDRGITRCWTKNPICRVFWISPSLTRASRVEDHLAQNSHSGKIFNFSLNESLIVNLWIIAKRRSGLWSNWQQTRLSAKKIGFLNKFSVWSSNRRRKLMKITEILIFVILSAKHLAQTNPWLKCTIWRIFW
jgi:hypothetical protein